jgi:hypothetical protein
MDSGATNATTISKIAFKAARDSRYSVQGAANLEFS